jgi:hypothetical protein
MIGYACVTSHTLDFFPLCDRSLLSYSPSHQTFRYNTTANYQTRRPPTAPPSPYHPGRTVIHTSPTMRSAILATLFAASALTTAAPPSTPPSTPPSAYMDTYPGGSIVLVSNMTGQRPTEFRYPININKVTVVDPPSSAINNITEVKFFYFLNVEEAKVECHAYLDEAGLKPFRKPFTKVKPLNTTSEGKAIPIKSVLCIVVA